VVRGVYWLVMGARIVGSKSLFHLSCFTSFEL